MKYCLPQIHDRQSDHRSSIINHLIIDRRGRDPLVAFEDQLSSVRDHIHLRDETFLSELLAMRSHGIHGGRHVAGGVRDLSAAFVPGQTGCGTAGARASGERGQRGANGNDSRHRHSFAAKKLVV